MAHDFPFRLEFRTKHEMALDPDSALHPPLPERASCKINMLCRYIQTEKHMKIEY